MRWTVALVCLILEWECLVVCVHLHVMEETSYFTVEARWRR